MRPVPLKNEIILFSLYALAMGQAPAVAKIVASVHAVFRYRHLTGG